MLAWGDKPTEMKDDWPEGIDHVLFVDENNHANLLKAAQKAVQSNRTVAKDNRYFTVTG